MDAHDTTMSILDQLQSITRDAGAFAAGVLSDDLSREDQIGFAVLLVDLALAIRQRAESTAGLVVEGSVIDDGNTHGRALPSAGPGR
jgi:predicted DNA repair protein MutK